MTSSDAINRSENLWFQKFVHDISGGESQIQPFVHSDRSNFFVKIECEFVPVKSLPWHPDTTGIFKIWIWKMAQEISLCFQFDEISDQTW